MKPLKNYHGAIRRHQFPPLRKAWQKNVQPGDRPADPAEYQQQLMAGFQQGINDGFEQGLTQGKEQGYQDGLLRGEEEGRRQGKEAGRQQAREEFMRAAQPLDTLTAQLQQALDDYEQRRRHELLQLVEKVTRQVIRCELALQPGQMLALVEEALTSLPEPPKRLRVLLNPEEFSRISELEPEKVSEWGLCADSEMLQGECRIITDSAEMDVGCDHRLQQCMSVLDQTLTDAS
ncbi:flagellar assembly protein FliH [Erwinia oleae]|uniref:flagellar assembly protein FliH n=1 Tax=Erwinia oleae TaxID=796334 RepID=UPI00055070DF|nr:flagellar assembly protein FliH [Erwinia oleae]